MTEENEQFAEIFCLIVEIAEKDNIFAINQFPACWERELPNGWAFAVNGHREAIADKRGGSVSPFHAAIYRNNTFQGFVDPYGGILISSEVESTLITVMKSVLGMKSNA